MCASVWLGRVWVSLGVSLGVVVGGLCCGCEWTNVGVWMMGVSASGWV